MEACEELCVGARHDHGEKWIPTAAQWSKIHGHPVVGQRHEHLLQQLPRVALAPHAEDADVAAAVTKHAVHRSQHDASYVKCWRLLRRRPRVATVSLAVVRRRHQWLPVEE